MPQGCTKNAIDKMIITAMRGLCLCLRIRTTKGVQFWLCVCMCTWGIFHPKVFFIAVRGRVGSCYCNWAQRGAGRRPSQEHSTTWRMSAITSYRQHVYVCMCAHVWWGKCDGFQWGWSHRSVVTMVTGLSGPQGGKRRGWGARRDRENYGDWGWRLYRTISND